MIYCGVTEKYMLVVIHANDRIYKLLLNIRMFRRRGLSLISILLLITLLSLLKGKEVNKRFPVTFRRDNVRCLYQRRLAEYLV